MILAARLRCAQLCIYGSYPSQFFGAQVQTHALRIDPILNDLFHQFDCFTGPLQAICTLGKVNISFVRAIRILRTRGTDRCLCFLSCSHCALCHSIIHIPEVYDYTLISIFKNYLSFSCHIFKSNICPQDISYLCLKTFVRVEAC